MTRPQNNDDPALRGLLDSLGIREGDQVEHVPDPDASLRAGALLARILEQPTAADARHPAPRQRRTGRRWAPLTLAAGAATCVLVVVAVLVFGPGPGTSPAAAQTPPMLSFSLAGPDEIGAAGDPARAALLALAERAANLPTPRALPVQRITAQAWWSSTDPADATGPTRTVLVPRHLEVFQFTDGSRRLIERRGAAIDARGRIAEEPGSWEAVAPTTDETVPNDQGANYPRSLPVSLAGLRRQLAPTGGCGARTGGCLLSAVSDLHAGYVVDPATTSRLWRLLASDPTISTLGTTTDRLGRAAEVFVADALDATQRILLLIDPETGRFLGSETILVRPNPDLGFDPPAVTQFTAILGAKRVPASSVPDDRTTTRY